MIVVGDRGMITSTHIDELRGLEGMDWISALRPDAVRRLAEQGAIQLTFFDERNLGEIQHPDYPGERLIACRNSKLAERRRAKRCSLLAATQRALEKVRAMTTRGRLQGQAVIAEHARKVLAGYRAGRYVTLEVREDGFTYQLDEDAMVREEQARGGAEELVARRSERQRGMMGKLAVKLAKLQQRTQRGRLYGKDKIGVRVGRVLNHYSMAKHFTLEIEDARFTYAIDEAHVAAEAAVDGIYLVRTSVSQACLAADDVVRSYKQLSEVERAFRCFKDIDLSVRPIRHRLETRVRAHIFICMLAYYVKWHMIEAWRPLLFCDEDKQAKLRRDPVAAAKRSNAAQQKVQSKRLPDGSVVHSFKTLMESLAALTRDTCCRAGAPDEAPTFFSFTPPGPTQQKAYDLLDALRVGSDGS
jgi:hypothetical protein